MSWVACPLKDNLDSYLWLFLKKDAMDLRKWDYRIYDK